MLLDSYCKVVHLFWDHNWLKPRTRVSIMVKSWTCKSGRGGCFWTHIANWYIYFFDDQNINICLCFIGILIILGVHLGDPGGGESWHTTTMCNSRRRWICRAAGGLTFHLLYFLVLFFFVVLLCIVLRSICPSPPLEAGD